MTSYRGRFKHLIAIYNLVKIKNIKDRFGSTKCKVTFGFKYIFNCANEKTGMFYNLKFHDNKSNKHAKSAIKEMCSPLALLQSTDMSFILLIAIYFNCANDKTVILYKFHDNKSNKHAKSAVKDSYSPLALLQSTDMSFILYIVNSNLFLEYCARFMTIKVINTQKVSLKIIVVH